MAFPFPLNIAVPSNAALGTYSVSVTASVNPSTSNGQASTSATFPFYVADYGGSVNSPAVTIAQGSSGTVTATVTATQGFVGVVTFSCSGASQLSCSFSPGTVQPTSSSPQTVTITILASQSAILVPSRVPIVASALWMTGALLGIFLSGKGAKSALLCLLIVMSLTIASCGGGGSSGTSGGSGGNPPPSGSNNYTLTVTAAASGTSTTRTLGIVNVTVTH